MLIGKPTFCPDCGSALFWKKVWKKDDLLKKQDTTNTWGKKCSLIDTTDLNSDHSDKTLNPLNLPTPNI